MGSTCSYADGVGTSAALRFVEGVYVETTGQVFFSDRENNRVRIVTSSGSVSLLAGSGTGSYADGVGNSAHFDNPIGLTRDVVSELTYVVDNINQRVRTISTAGLINVLL